MGDGTAHSVDGECCNGMPEKLEVLIQDAAESPFRLAPTGATVSFRGRDIVFTAADLQQISANAELPLSKAREADEQRAPMVPSALERLRLTLQAALGLENPPVGLEIRLRGLVGVEQVLCPLSTLLACPTHVMDLSEGRKWEPVFASSAGGGGGGGGTAASRGAAASAAGGRRRRRKEPVTAEAATPQNGGNLASYSAVAASKLLPDVAAAPSPSEGYGRPLTAPPGDRGRPRLRPMRTEGLGRPMTATPSDKRLGSSGAGGGSTLFRPGRTEGFGRPATALPSDHSASPSWCRRPDSVGGPSSVRSVPGRGWTPCNGNAFAQTFPSVSALSVVKQEAAPTLSEVYLAATPFSAVASAAPPNMAVAAAATAYRPAVREAWA